MNKTYSTGKVPVNKIYPTGTVQYSATMQVCNYAIKSESYTVIWSQSSHFVTFQTKHRIKIRSVQKLLSLFGTLLENVA